MWDTLVIGLKAPKGRNDYAHAVHMPDGAIPGVIEALKRKRMEPEK
jgi:hypothetical protein